MGALNSIGYVMTKENMIANYKIERIWKETVTIWLSYYYVNDFLEERRDVNQDSLVLDRESLLTALESKENSNSYTLMFVYYSS